MKRRGRPPKHPPDTYDPFQEIALSMEDVRNEMKFTQTTLTVLADRIEALRRLIQKIRQQRRIENDQANL